MNGNPLALGLDVGGTKIAAGLVDPEGVVVDVTTTPTEGSGDDVVSQVAGIIADYARRYAIDHVGLAVPGGVDPASGVVTAAVNLGWADLDVVGQLSRRLDGTAVHVDNDANAATWAEHRFGRHPHGESLVLVTVGTGLGGGVVVNDELVRGFTGAGGEVGHMPFVFEGRPCNCGSFGCWEQYASGRALHRAAQAAGWDAAIAGPAVLAAAAGGNAAAVLVVEDVARDLVRGLAVVTAVVDPAQVVLGGGLGADPRFLPFVHQAADAMTITPPRSRVDIRVAALGALAGVIGAADLARAGAAGNAAR